jgi:hypothetical protein
MFYSRDAADSGHEVFPTLLFRAEHPAPFRSEAVIPAAALLRLLDPLALDPALSFEAVEQGIQGGDMEAQGAAGADLDQFRDVVTVTGLGFEEREDQELGAAFLPFRVGLGIVWFHIWASNISTQDIDGC